jgi:hypothetical protein
MVQRMPWVHTPWFYDFKSREELNAHGPPLPLLFIDFIIFNLLVVQGAIP